ncbi:hypothetical protein RFI_34853, partial [Reticulomyxa filosa]
SLEGYFRNFGGLDHSDYRKQLSKILKDVLNRTESEVIQELKKWTPVMCVERNLMEKKRGQSSDDLMVSRHCMIISENYYSWQLLLEYNILDFNQIFLFRSYFPDDKHSNIANYNQLNKIIDCMGTGKTVILHKLESICESLYDMLNQRYQIRPSGNVYCRVALGTESRDCFVHENFKCVIVVQKEDAHSNMPIAFLSRFEKQFISYRNSLPSNINQHVEYAKIVLMEEFKVRNLSNLFCGYCEDTIFSALLYLAAQKAMQTNDIEDDDKKEQTQILNKNLNDIEFGKDELKSKLLNLFHPLCRSEEIMKMQRNEDIQSYSLGTIVETKKKNSKDQMAMIITNDTERNIPIEWIHCTKEISSFKKVDKFEKTVKEFFNNEVSEDVLILQCRYTPKSKYQLGQIIHILQLEHHLFYKNSENGKKHKLIILLIHTSKKSLFPLIFRQKWNIIYVDYLLSTDTILSQKDLKEQVANAIDRQLKQVKKYFFLFFRIDDGHCLKENLYRHCLKDKGCVAILVKRLTTLLSKIAAYNSIEYILYNLEKSGKKRMKGSFFERYQDIIDTLLTLTFVNVLIAVYQNGGFA